MSDVFCTVPEQDQVIDFFDFQFTVGGELKQCTHHGEKIDDEFWVAIFTVYQYYTKKNDRLKLAKKTIKNQSKAHAEQLEAWQKAKAHYIEHITKAEAKLSEYKNTILAFGVMASRSLTK